jgi:hypothetical protein
MFVCKTCSSKFEAKADYNAHKKTCLMQIETFVFRQTNQKITVKKNDEGNFECYCSDAGCPDKKKVYKSIENLKRHLKKVESHWIGLSKVSLISIHVYK